MNLCLLCFFSYSVLDIIRFFWLQFIETQTNNYYYNILFIFLNNLCNLLIFFYSNIMNFLLFYLL